MNLHINKKLFKEAILAASQHFNIREVYIEKDYWVTYILHNLANSYLKKKVVFKGGTSLSKVYRLINRFSEDIDLAVIIEEDMTGNQIKNLIKKIEKEITKGLTEVYIKDITSKGSKFRKTVYEYEKLTGYTNYGLVRDKLLVEINSFAIPVPYHAAKPDSFIADFFAKTGKDDFLEEFKMEPFEILVLGLDKTFVEKVLSLIRISYGEKPIEGLKNKIRYVYDLHQMLKDPGIKSFIGSDAFFDMLSEVREADKKNREFHGEWSEKPLADSPVFAKTKETWKALDKTYYSDFKPLVYGNLPGHEELISTLKPFQYG